MTPMSECRTSRTRCCVCRSCGATRWSGDDGAGPSPGNFDVPSSVGAEALLISGPRLSVLSTGRMVGGAAMAGNVVFATVGP